MFSPFNKEASIKTYIYWRYLELRDSVVICRSITSVFRITSEFVLNKHFFPLFSATKIHTMPIKTNHIRVFIETVAVNFTGLPILFWKIGSRILKFPAVILKTTATEGSILFSLEAMSNSPQTSVRAGSGPELLSFLQLYAQEDVLRSWGGRSTKPGYSFVNCPKS